MVQNKLGRKIIGATLSMVMMASAIPAMTSLASENAPQSYEATASTISRAQAISNLHDTLTLAASLRNNKRAELSLVTN